MAIRVSNLTKKYNDLTAVDSISFEVRKGEIFGFIGPNGAGKTTTVRMLTGVIKPAEGEALVMGYEAGTLKAKQAAGVVPEMANAYADLSGWKNMNLMGKIYGIPKSVIKDRSEELLKKVNLYLRKDEPVRAYSKGMKQRLILVMALISDPEIIFLDEPTVGLDVQSTRMIRGFLQKLNGDGKTIFLTTHQMEEADQLCSRIAIIDRGVIVKIDSPEKIRTAIRGMHSVEVSFDRVVDHRFLSSLAEVKSLKKTGDKYRLYTENPGKTVVSLAKQVSAMNMSIMSLNVLPPSLEDAFLALIGRRE
ncbi:MAG: ATP-binding cassette domain-containing protein [Candidatus Aminicenantes bacterium]